MRKQFVSIHIKISSRTDKGEGTVVFFHRSWCSSVSIRGLVCGRIETGRRPASRAAGVRNAVEWEVLIEKMSDRRRLVLSCPSAMAFFVFLSSFFRFYVETARTKIGRK